LEILPYGKYSVSEIFSPVSLRSRLVLPRWSEMWKIIPVGGAMFWRVIGENSCVNGFIFSGFGSL